MEQEQQRTFYSAIMVTGVTFGILNFVLNVMNGYMTMNLDPDVNPVLNVSTYGPFFICLITLASGLAGVWWYARQADVPLSMGQGAGLGALVGFSMVITAVLLELVWAAVNPGFYDQIFQTMVTIFENSELPEQQKQMLIDQLYTTTKNKFTLSNIFFNILGGSFTAMLNALTGMLGVKLFITQPDEF